MVFIGGMDPIYVLDQMDLYEIEIALGGLYLKDRESWEQTRLVLYSIAQSNTKERINPKDMIHFPWDDEIKAPHAEEEDEEYTRWIEEQMERIVTEKNKKNGSGSCNTVVAGQ